MGTLKIEIDLPEFEKELELNIIIKRDGEVICRSSSSTPGDDIPEVTTRVKAGDGKLPKVVKEEKKAVQKKSTAGNLMNLEI